LWRVWLGHTRVSQQSLQFARRQIAAYDNRSPAELLAGEYVRLEQRQPTVGERLGSKLSAPLDDAARALGVNLALVVWRSFEHAAAGQLRVVQPADWELAEQFLRVDEELRKRDASAVVESDDVVAVLQPELAAYVRERVEATVRGCEELDLDDVDAVYRLILVQVLALSYAVEPPAGLAGSEHSS
jgi:hypothetical protein